MKSPAQLAYFDQVWARLAEHLNCLIAIHARHLQDPQSAGWEVDVSSLADHLQTSLDHESCADMAAAAIHRLSELSTRDTGV